jgi:hypothetical protein
MLVSKEPESKIQEPGGAGLSKRWELDWSGSSGSNRIPVRRVFMDRFGDTKAGEAAARLDGPGPPGSFFSRPWPWLVQFLLNDSGDPSKAGRCRHFN